MSLLWQARHKKTDSKMVKYCIIFIFIFIFLFIFLYIFFIFTLNNQTTYHANLKIQTIWLPVMCLKTAGCIANNVDRYQIDTTSHSIWSVSTLTAQALTWVNTIFSFFLFNPFCMADQIRYLCKQCRSGPSCSKLTTSLVNDSLKFKSSDMQISWNFLLKKCE